MTILKTMITGLVVLLLLLISCNESPLDTENANAVATDKNALAIIYAAGDNANSVTKDVGLPASGASGTSISWVTSKSSVITTEGVVTSPDSASGDATVTLTATISKGTASDVKVFVVTVIAKGTKIPVTGVTVKSATSIEVGATEQLIATIVPSTATNKAVTWLSSAVSKATVSTSGLVTGIAEGTSVVTVTTVDGNFTGQCLVTVTKSIIVEGTVTDIDGNVYKTIKIGNQEWMAENLRVTRYNDGSAIPHVSDSAAWAALSTAGYCYNNNATNLDTIKKWGALYNWYVVSPTNTKKIAPAGWHVPTDAEWTILEKYLVLNGYNWDGTTDTSGTAYNKIAKSLASKTDWHSSTNSEGAIGNDLTTNNRSGFSALPGGYRNGDGNFYSQSSNGIWWSATEYAASHAYGRDLSYNYENLSWGYFSKSCGFSVRLLRD